MVLITMNGYTCIMDLELYIRFEEADVVICLMMLAEKRLMLS